MFSEYECFYLKPGEIHEAESESVVNTVLGSCISVTMYIRKLRYGLICHCMLPASSENIKRGDDCMKFVDCAVLCMNKKLNSMGITRKETEVKLFGGSDMFSAKQPLETVGRKNVAAAKEILQKLGYIIMAQDTGGQFTRKLYFSLDTGTVYLRKISKMQGI